MENSKNSNDQKWQYSRLKTTENVISKTVLKSGSVTFTALCSSMFDCSVFARIDTLKLSENPIFPGFIYLLDVDVNHICKSKEW